MHTNLMANQWFNIAAQYLLLKLWQKVAQEALKGLILHILE